jgi:hypothetical protein
MAEAGRIQEFDTQTRKPGRECATDCALSDIGIRHNGGGLLVTAPETSRTLRINASSMSLDGTCKIPDKIFGVVCCDASSNPALLLRHTGWPWIIGNPNFETNSVAVEFPGGSSSSLVFAGGCSSRWLLLAELQYGSTNIRLHAYPVTPCMSVMSQYAALAAQPGVRSNRASYQQMDQLARQLNSVRLTYDLSGIVVATEGSTADRILIWDSGERFVFAKRVFRISSSSFKCEGYFESPLLNAFKDEKLKPKIQALENIFSVSADGKWAVSGACVYDVDTRQAVKMLPFPSAVHAFTRDGAGMYLAGAKRLYFFSDWRAQFPAVEKAP